MKKSNITQFRAREEYSVFKVKNRIDFGDLNTLVLENLNVKDAAEELTKSLRMNGFNLLCSTKNVETLRCLKQFEGYGDVVPDVASPGDVLVFKTARDRSDMTFDKILRKAC